MAEEPALGAARTISVGADKAYDTRDFVQTLREFGMRVHVAQDLKRSGVSALDQRTVRHENYQISQNKRPLIEKVFGWMKQTGGMRKTKLRGLKQTSSWHASILNRGVSRGLRSTGLRRDVVEEQGHDPPQKG